MVVRSLAQRWGIVDRPDGRRKLHRRPIPLLGGAAVYGAAVLGLLAFCFFNVSGVTDAFLELAAVWLVAAGFVCLVGGIDDRYDLPPRVKLALQIVSVLPIVSFGYYIDRVVAFGIPIELGWLGIPLTVLWLVGCINALNLIDGMDGLASIVGLAAATMMGLIAANEGHPHVSVMAMVLAASLLGFLMYNLPPASVFLGDSGSMVIGLTLGLLGLQGTLKTTATLAITAPAVVMTLPMLDVLAAVVRRKLTGRRIDSADRQHIHHRLLDRGWTPWQVLCLIGAICLTTGGAATAATIFRRDALAWITAVTLIVLMVRLKIFGHEEFALIKGLIVQTMNSAISVFIGAKKTRFGIHDSGLGVEALALRLESELPGRDVLLPGNVLWDDFLRNARSWNLQNVELTASRERQTRRIRWIDPKAGIPENCCWSLSVSLPDAIGEICEIRVSSVRAIANQRDVAALTALLKAYGTYFATHLDQLFGPAMELEEPITLYPESQRKAA